MKNNFTINLHHAAALLITVLLLGSCFVIDRELFSGLITAKHLWVQAVSMLAIGALAFQVWWVKQFSIKIIDILVVLLCVWMAGREFWSGMPHANPSAYLLNITIYFSLYLFVRTLGSNKTLIKSILLIYLLLVVSLAIIGLIQLYGFTPSYHSLFKITGTFHNPGPFSGFVVSGLPMALGLYLVTVSRNQLSVISGQLAEGKFSLLLRVWFWVKNQFCEVNTDKLLNYFAQFVIIVLLLVLPAARSRAAWLGGVIGCLYIAWQLKLYRKVTQRLTESRKEKLSGSLRKFIMPFAILLFFVSVFGLYKFKQGSADGRLLMWQVSWEMIKDKPFAGWGQGGFEANYANYQAEWFKSGKGTEAQSLVAGAPDAPFNELLRAVINYGIVGAFIIVALLLLLYRKWSQRTTEDHKEKLGGSLRKNVASFTILKGGLLSIMVFAFFSYSVDVAPIMVQMILLVGILV